MQYEDLKKFTYADLQHLTYEEVLEDPEKLLARMRNDDRELPLSMIEKIQELCKQIPESPQPSKLKRVKDAVGILIFFVNAVKATQELSQLVQPLLEKFIDLCIS